MADFTFLHVFGASLVVSVFKHCVFNPMNMAKTLQELSAGGAQAKSNAPQNPMQMMMGGMQGVSQMISQINPEMAKAIGDIGPAANGESGRNALGQPRKQTKEEREYESA